MAIDTGIRREDSWGRSGWMRCCGDWWRVEEDARGGEDERQA